MPMIDIEFVLAEGEALPAPQPLADALGQALNSPPGRCWLRLRSLPVAAYAENGRSPPELPVFVTVLLSQPPEGAERVDLVRLLTHTVATVLSCSSERVHVQLAPAAAGRQAFGGRLV